MVVIITKHRLILLETGRIFARLVDVIGDPRRLILFVKTGSMFPSLESITVFSVD